MRVASGLCTSELLLKVYRWICISSALEATLETVFLLLQRIRRQINCAINAFILCQHNSLAHPHYFIVTYFEGLPDSSVFQSERRKNQSNNLNDHKYTFESLLQGKAAKSTNAIWSSLHYFVPFYSSTDCPKSNVHAVTANYASLWITAQSRLPHLQTGTNIPHAIVLFTSIGPPAGWQLSKPKWRVDILTASSFWCLDWNY